MKYSLALLVCLTFPMHGFGRFGVTSNGGDHTVDTGASDKLDRVTWSIKYAKPVFISEFGADAKHGLHGDARARFTEEEDLKL